MSDLIQQAGFDDDSIPSSRLDNYKAKEGKTDRIAIAWLSEEPNQKSGKRDPQVIWTNSYYVQGKGFILHKPGFEKILKKQAKKRFGTVIIEFRTDPKGELLRDDKDKPVISYEVKPWYFSEKKYNDLKGLHNKWDLSLHDLEITCVEEQYQNITIQPHPKSYLDKMMGTDRYRDKLIEQINTVKDQLEMNIARDLSEAELRDDEDEDQTVTDESTEFSDSDEMIDDVLDGIE